MVAQEDKWGGFQSLKCFVPVTRISVDLKHSMALYPVEAEIFHIQSGKFDLELCKEKNYLIKNLKQIVKKFLNSCYTVKWAI